MSIEMSIEEIVQKLSLKEKIRLCSGVDFWSTEALPQFDLPAVMLSDGPHGLRCQKNSEDMLGVYDSEPATCFPTASLTACSWDRELLGKIGGAIAEEARAYGVGVVLGPGVNIKRDPLCGRNFEYFSEDPVLAGQLSAAFIRSAQTTGVGTSLKHFALNNQEYKRFNGDSQVDDRTMREIYLAPFETAVKEGKPATVMSAYNKINGTHCSDSKLLLTDILREEWGFEGLVVTDWGGMNNRIAAMRAGCDLSMPGGSDYMEKELERAVLDGELLESDIDNCVLRVLKLMSESKPISEPTGSFDVESHHSLAKQAAMESAVLLKNADDILPLDTNANIALLGCMAEIPRYQGAGSSHINPTKLTSIRDSLPGTLYVPGYNPDGSTTETMLTEAANIAKAVEVAVVVVGLPDSYESEGFDRDTMKMPEGHLKLIDTVSVANPNTVIVLCSGSVVECPWADRVKAILYMGLSGQAGGEAIVDLLFGKSNPCGKLAESWPAVYEDCVTADNYRNLKNPQYREGIYVGYRYYDKAKVEVRWPFGFGLSYTHFSYSNLVIDGNLVTAEITNTGQAAGSEIVQLYIAPPQDGLYRPVKELKGFQKLFLQPGESRTVSFELCDRCFAVWNEGWKIPSGDYEIQIGTNSRNILLSATVHKEGEEVAIPHWQSGSWYEAPFGTPSQTQWEIMYGRVVLDTKPAKGNFTMDSTILEMRDHSFVMRCMQYFAEKTIAKSFGGKRDYSNPNFKMLVASSVDSPLRSMHINSGMKGGIFSGLLDMANGHFLRGLVKMIKG
jgi:beta-glucosidase